MTTLVEYHQKTEEIALFESDRVFWIGSYSKFMTHQNGEPPFVWIRGDFPTKEEGLQVLYSLKGDEF